MRAQRIDAYLRKQRSPLAGLGATFVSEAQRNGIPPGLLVAIAGAESSFGRINSGTHNAWGWGPGINFPSWQAAIGAVARGLRSGYFNEGRTTVPAIGAKWAPSGASNDPTNLNSNWVKNVQKFMRELGGGMPLQSAVSPAAALPGGNIGSGNTSSLPDLSGLAFQNLGQIGMGRYPNPVASLDSLVQSVAAMGSPPSTAGPATSSPLPVTGDTSLVHLASGADRAGMSTHPQVLSFVGKIASLYGSPLTIGTGTNHNQYVAGTHRQSDHWTGWAADIPASGANLTRMGQDALIAAGMNPAQARRQHGGLFNVGSYQVIFNSNQGGNHFNHLHVGLRRH